VSVIDLRQLIDAARTESLPTASTLMSKPSAAGTMTTARRASWCRWA